MSFGSQMLLFLLICFHLLSGEVHGRKHNFVFVHGFGGAGWQWFKVKSLLDGAGHNTSCLDLKTAGLDTTPVEYIKTFHQFNEPLIQLLSRIPDDQKVILVGASAGGVSLTHAIHKFPKKIKVAVFIAATMLRRGFRTNEDKKIGIPGKYKHVRGEFWNNVRTREAYNKTSPEDEALRELLRKPDTVSKEVIMRAKFPETQGIDKVRRVYVRTTHDEMLLPWQQKKMIEKWPPSHVFSLTSVHDAHLAAPSGVYELLIRVAEMC